MSASGLEFFLDNNISLKIAAGMRAFGESVHHLQDEFPEDAKDIDWLPVLGKRGWILVTRDERIRYNRLEREQFSAHSIGAFFLSGKNMGRCEQIQQVVKAWPRMKYEAQKARRPFALRVARNGGKIEPMSI